MSVQLERIYLLNVLLYIDSLESVKKFISINKKCQEVSTMLRLYTKRRRNDIDFSHEKIIPRNLFTLFPMIQTIQCNDNDLLHYSEIMKQVTFIHLTIERNTTNGMKQKRIKIDQKIPLSIRNKVQLVKYERYNYIYDVPFDKLFPKCKILIANYNTCLQIFENIGNMEFEKVLTILEKIPKYSEYDDFEEEESDDSQHSSESLEAFDSSDLDEEFESEFDDSNEQIEERYNFKRPNLEMVIKHPKLLWSDEEKKVKKEILNEFGKMYDPIHYFILDNYEPSDYFDLNSKEIDLYEWEKMMNEKYPYVLINDINLKNYTQLERIVLGLQHKKVLIDGLKNLKEVGLKFSKPLNEVYDVETLPESVSKIIFTVNAHYEFDDYFFGDEDDKEIEDKANDLGFKYDAIPQNIKAVEIRVINKQSGLCEEDYRYHFPPYNIVLDELKVIEMIEIPDYLNTYYHVSSLPNELKRYKNVKEIKLIRRYRAEYSDDNNRSICEYCEDTFDERFFDLKFLDMLYTSGETVETPKPEKRLINLKRESSIVVNYGNIDEIPVNQKQLRIWNNFDASFIKNKKVFEQIEAIHWSWRLGEKEYAEFNLSKFVNCKKLFIGTLDEGNVFYQTNGFKFPPNLEEIVIADAGCDKAADCFDLRSLTKLKRVILGKNVSINLPIKHLDYVELNNSNVKNIKYISIETVVENGKVIKDWNIELKEKLQNFVPTKLITVSYGKNKIKETEKRISLIPKKTFDRYEYTFLDIFKVKLPQEMDFVSIEEDQIEIKNINEVKINELQLQREGEKTRIFKNWNKESEEELKQRKQIDFIVFNYLDLSRFVNLEKVKLTGNGKVKLPPNVKILELHCFSSEIKIENVENYTFDKLKIVVYSQGNDEFDFKEFKVTNVIEVRNIDYGLSRLNVEIPTKCQKVFYDNFINIKNEDAIECDEIEEVEYILNRNTYIGRYLVKFYGGY